MDFSASSLKVASQSVALQSDEESEEIDDETTDSEVEKKETAKLRMQSIFNRESVESLEDSNAPTNCNKFLHCYICDKLITDLVVWGLNKPHHCTCFNCFYCCKSIAFKKFKVLENKITICYKDYYEAYQLCRICQKSINEATKQNYKQLYHESCFKCVNCFQPLKENKTKELFDETYCSNCAMNIVKKKTILMNHYRALGRTFRRKHFLSLT